MGTLPKDVEFYACFKSLKILKKFDNNFFDALSQFCPQTLNQLKIVLFCTYFDRFK